MPATPFEASLRQAHAALRAGRAATAERWLQTLLAQHPDEVDCLWLLGVALLYQDKITDSIATLEGVLGRAPDISQARVDLARAYRRDGRPAQAREEVRRVLEKTPHHHLAWLAYGDAHIDLGQHSDARVAFERAQLTDPYKQLIETATAALVADDRQKSEQLFRRRHCARSVRRKAHRCRGPRTLARRPSVSGPTRLSGVAASDYLIPPSSTCWRATSGL